MISVIFDGWTTDQVFGLMIFFGVAIGILSLISDARNKRR